MITHCCATNLQNKLDKGLGHVLKPDILTDYLQELEAKLQYKHLYFGHYHMDVNIDHKHTLLYFEIVKLYEENELRKVSISKRPRYCRGDMVRFLWADTEKIGKISIIDVHGTFEQRKECSYDIISEEDNCLYKHIGESEIVERGLRIDQWCIE